MASNVRPTAATAFRVAAASILVLVLTSCGTTQVRQGARYSGALPRPDTIYVHPFAASPEDVKVHMGLGAHLMGHASYGDRTAKEIETGRRLANAIARKLVTEIDKMGLSARFAEGPPAEGLDAVIIDGALLSVDEGNQAKRAVIGLGTGRSKLNLSVHVFEVMPGGRRQIDSFQIDATGGWKPGAAETGIVGLALHANPAVMVLSSVATTVASEKLSAGIDATAKHCAERTAEVLGRFFAREGWIR
jgi:hypothetical protein